MVYGQKGIEHQESKVYKNDNVIRLKSHVRYHKGFTPVQFQNMILFSYIDFLTIHPCTLITECVKPGASSDTPTAG